MALEIRDAEAGDEAAWRRLSGDYLAFYAVDLDDAVTAQTWARILDPASRVKIRVALDAGRMVGFAIHHHHDSTWVMTPDGYLEDLYLDPDARGKGIGRALIDDLIAICRANGWSRLYWHTNRDNAQARKLYESYVEDQGYMRYRIDLR